MTAEQIDWILALDPSVRDQYLQRVRTAYRPAYVKWGHFMGQPHWMTVLQALCGKLNVLSNPDILCPCYIYFLEIDITIRIELGST